MRQTLIVRLLVLVILIGFVCLSRSQEYAPLFELEVDGRLKHLATPIASKYYKAGRKKRSVSDGEEGADENGDVVLMEEGSGEAETEFTVLTNDRNKTMTRLSVDLLLLIDYSVYQKYLERYNGNGYSTDASLHEYFLNILAEVGRIYNEIRSDENFVFKIWPAGIILSKTPESTSWIDSSYFNETEVGDAVPLDAYDVLQNLRKYMKQQGHNLPEHDHVVAFTHKDLYQRGDSLTQGIAYVKSICNPVNSVSLAEDIGAMATVAVIAHEVAHSLGAEHDGTEAAKDCPINLNYLMVPSVSSQPETLHNSFRLSSCSLRQIFDYVKNHKSETECLRHSPRDDIVYYGPNGLNGDGPIDTVPGQLYSPNQQCQQTFGKHYRFCGVEDYYLSQMCNRLWCRDRRQGRYSPCYTKHYLPAFFGTSCGNKMWCMNGACVEDRRAPSKPDCHFGDRDSNFCIKLVTQNSQTCAMDTFKRFCCKTCKNWKVFGVADADFGGRRRSSENRRRHFMARFKFLN